MAEVKFALGDSSNLNNVVKSPGQIIMTKDKEYLEMYLDYQDENTVARKKLDFDHGTNITYAAYQELTEEEKAHGTYYIVDKDPTLHLEWVPFN